MGVFNGMHGRKYSAEVYGVPESISAKARKVYGLRDTKRGAILYLELEHEVQDAGYPDDILFDLAAEFDPNYPWDDVADDIPSDISWETAD